jgi:two-component system phosphate regulon response regulator PhoB
MQKIDVLLTSDLAGGTEPFHHGELRVSFWRWAGVGEVPLIEGAPWAFIDWELPGLSGLEICRRLRCDPLTAHAHVTIVLDDDQNKKRLALRGGADDYIVGPVDRRMLLDRLLAMKLRHSQNRVRQSIELGALTVDLTAFQARWQDQPIALRPTEFRLLRYFAEHPGRVFTRAQLIDALGKHDLQIDERTVDVWVGRLRRALRAAGAVDALRTVRSLGYVLDQP